MTLAAGSRLGIYEVVAPLGAGGMGEVFRARDTKLGREVALKVLPAALALDGERLARFEREAQLLAALNHPHIAAIYGVEDSTPVKALVLELVEGETLADRIAAGRVPVPQAIAIARQIAEALAAAHEKGIVHRDLKPANVKVDPDDRVKVLDFGLAKALDPAGMSGTGTASPGASPTLMQSPTLTAAGTQLGVILGTAAYMAPEQARGAAVDKRADIFAFGAVLYEMLAGRRAFEGDTVSDTLAAVLRADPDWAALPVETPPALRTLLARCLQKDRKERLADIGDARFELDAALAPVSAPASSTEPAPPSNRRERLAWLVALLLAAGLAAALLAPRSRGAAAGETRLTWLSLDLPADLVPELEGSPAIAISPDGRRIVQVVRDRRGTKLLLRDLDALDPRLLEGSEGADSPAFSPDGQWIAFVARAEFKRIAVHGGPAVVMASTEGLGQSRGAVYDSAGGFVFAPNSNVGLSRIGGQGEAARPLTTPDAARAERTHRWPAKVPGRDAVLFTCDTLTSTELYDDARIEAVEIATGERHVVLEGASRAMVVGDELVFARGGNLFAVAFDAGRLATSGAPRLVLQGVATDTSTGAAHFDVAANGTLVYVPGAASAAQATLSRYDFEGNEIPGILASGLWSQMTLSPDGRLVGLSGSLGPTVDGWIHDLERGTLSRLTFEGSVTDPVFSADGRKLAFGLQQGNANIAVAWTSSSGGAKPEILFAGERGAMPRAFSPDGRYLVADSMTATGVSDLWVVPLSGGEKPFPFTETQFDEYMASFSPDGRYLAYNSNENGTYEVFVRPFPRGEGRWQISVSGGTEPRFSADGKWLFYRAVGDLFRVAIDRDPEFHAGDPERLAIAAPVGGGGNPNSYALSPDGKSILRLKSSATDGARRIAAIAFGWADELRRTRAAKS